MEQVRKVFVQTFWQLLARGVGALSNILVLAIVTRSFKAEGTGIFTLALTYLSMFFLAADFGLNAYVLPRLEDKDEANKLFNFRLVWSVILVIVANLLVFALPFDNELFRQSVFVGSLSIVLFGISNSTSLIFQSKLRYDQVSLAGLVGALSQIPVILYLTDLKVPVSFLAIGPLFGWLINNLICLLLVKKWFEFRISKIDFSYIMKTVKKAWPISLTLILNVVYFRADAFILSHYHSFGDVGYYNLAYQIFQNGLVLPSFIMNSYYPILLTKLVEGKDLFFKQAKTAGIILLAISVTGLVFSWVLSPFIIQILAGDGFEGSSQALRILSLSFPAYFLSALLMWILVSLKKYYSLVAIYFFGLLINIVLNLVYIPKYSYIGASWITGISEYLILGLQIIILFRLFKER